MGRSEKKNKNVSKYRFFKMVMTAQMKCALLVKSRSLMNDYTLLIKP